MFFTEPILILITLYITFIYSFIEERGYNASVSALPFISIGIGVALGSSYVAYITYTRIMANFKKNGFVTYVSPFCHSPLFISFSLLRYYGILRKRCSLTFSCRPEDRLYPMIFGAIIFPIGVFWFAWTSFPTINPWPQFLAGIPIGARIQVIYLQGLAYTVDVYTVNANSAISANAIVRYVSPVYSHNRSMSYSIVKGDG